MIGNRWVLSAVCAGLALAGCDRSQQSSTAPATQPAQNEQVATSSDLATDKGTAPKADPATKPAALPEISTLLVRGETANAGDPGFLYEFPRARLHINHDDKTATLYTDDPKTAINPDYTGNSYYLVIPLKGDEPFNLDGYHWEYRAFGSQHQDSAEGVFRGGQRFHYQPTALRIDFKVEGARVLVAVNGEFSRFDLQQSNEVGLPVSVNGVVSATVDPSK
jgi:hypothetical protein